MLDKLFLYAVAPLTFAGGLLGFDAPVAETSRSYGTAAATAGSGMRIARAADGLFYVPVSIGGQTLHMALDTGATRTVLPRGFVRSDKLRLHNDGGTIEMLDGRLRYDRATIDDVTVASQYFDRVEVVVADIEFPAPLLGQDLLRRLGPVTIDGDTLILR